MIRNVTTLTAALMIAGCTSKPTTLVEAEQPYNSKWEQQVIIEEQELMECPSRKGQYYKVGHEILCLEDTPKEPKEPKEPEQPMCKLSYLPERCE